MEILTYTHRDWFEPPPTAESRLQSRIAQLEFALERAREAHQHVEKRLRVAEDERDMYRDMARTWQSRIEHVLGNDDRAVMQHHEESEEEEGEHEEEGEEMADMEEDIETDDEDEAEDTLESMSISSPTLSSEIIVRSQVRTVSISSSDGL